VDERGGDGRWQVVGERVAVVLAGGNSSRLGARSARSRVKLEMGIREKVSCGLDTSQIGFPSLLRPTMDGSKLRSWAQVKNVLGEKHYLIYYGIDWTVVN
jgi:hypothetical protein